jgi:hypothetical protein
VKSIFTPLVYAMISRCDLANTARAISNRFTIWVSRGMAQMAGTTLFNVWTWAVPQRARAGKVQNNIVGPSSSEQLRVCQPYYVALSDMLHAASIRGLYESPQGSQHNLAFMLLYTAVNRRFCAPVMQTRFMVIWHFARLDSCHSTSAYIFFLVRRCWKNFLEVEQLYLLFFL